jgi:uroporphyrinogen III methyltransferase/synthase
MKTIKVEQTLAAARPGTVYLVGAGPGHPDLLTLRARALIASCDVLVYDQLTDVKTRAYAPAGCRFIDVGKHAGDPGVGQSAIQEQLISAAREGLAVVRLKGGDPFIFGRGGEEMDALAKAGVPYEVIPGVTAAVAAAGLAGIPLTHRDFNSGVYFLTGHEDPARAIDRINWEALGKTSATLCVYMGLSRLPGLVQRLVECGLPADTPAAMIQSASLPDQKTVRAPLSGMVEAVEKAELHSPVVLIIGKSAAFADNHGWFERRPLFGKRVALTRRGGPGSEWRQAFEDLGAEVLDLPAVRVQNEADPALAREILESITHYDWTIFTSRQGVDAFFEQFFNVYPDIRSIGPMRFAVVGQKTREALAAWRLEADLCPEEETSDGLIKALVGLDSLASASLLWVTGNLNDAGFLTRLEEEAGAMVDRFPVYKTEIIDPSNHPDAEVFRQSGADYVVFASASAVDGFMRQAKALAPVAGARVPTPVSIGPKTSAALDKAGLTNHLKAERPSLEAILEVILKSV